MRELFQPRTPSFLSSLADLLKPILGVLRTLHLAMASSRCSKCTVHGAAACSKVTFCKQFPASFSTWQELAGTGAVAFAHVSSRLCCIQFAKTAGGGIEGFVGRIQGDLRRSTRRALSKKHTSPRPFKAPTSWRHHSNFSRRCFASIFAYIGFTSKPFDCLHAACKSLQT